MEGDSEIVLPSYVSFQSVGLKGVTTSSPQPHAHLWTTVANFTDTYSVRSSRASGISSTNLWVKSALFMRGPR